MEDSELLKVYMKFLLSNFDDYLDVIIGLTEKPYRSELKELQAKLKSERVDFSEEERVNADMVLFLKYIELEGVELPKVKDNGAA